MELGPRKPRKTTRLAANAPNFSLVRLSGRDFPGQLLSEMEPRCKACADHLARAIWPVPSAANASSVLYSTRRPALGSSAHSLHRYPVLDEEEAGLRSSRSPGTGADATGRISATRGASGRPDQVSARSHERGQFDDCELVVSIAQRILSPELAPIGGWAVSGQRN
jgi:hypothetical protein